MKEPLTRQRLCVKIGFGISAAVIGYFLVTLITANYLVFSNSGLLQSLAAYFLTPLYFVSTHVFKVTFNEGIWAILLLAGFLASICGYEAVSTGLRRAIIDTLTLTGPGILFFYELGVYFFIPCCFYLQVVNFVSAIGLGGVLTNATLLVSSGVVFWASVIYMVLSRCK